MKNKEFYIAYAIARIGLGINIALHGFARIPTFDKFHAHMLSQFENSILPAGLVSIMSYVIVAMESVLGTMILLGIALRWALAGGGVLMWILLFGTCIISNWNVAGGQLVYLAFFAVLLAAARFDFLSVDTAIKAKRIPQI